MSQTFKGGWQEEEMWPATAQYDAVAEYENMNMTE